MGVCALPTYEGVAYGILPGCKPSVDSKLLEPHTCFHVARCEDDSRDGLRRLRKRRVLRRSAVRKLREIMQFAHQALSVDRETCDRGRGCHASVCRLKSL